MYNDNADHEGRDAQVVTRRDSPREAKLCQSTVNLGRRNYRCRGEGGGVGPLLAESALPAARVLRLRCAASYVLRSALLTAALTRILAVWSYYPPS
jgi:hypothetical protein